MMPDLQVLGIDQGAEQSAFVLWNGQEVLDHGILPNLDLLVWLVDWVDDWPILAIEEIVPYGKVVGKVTLDSIWWAGRFHQAWSGSEPQRWTRQQIAQQLMGISKHDDATFRQYLIDRFGGKDKAIGKKAAKGPFWGIKSHTWQALALAVAVWDKATLERILPLSTEYERPK